MFTIEDEDHCERIGPFFDSFESALAEARRLAEIPWDQEPNRCPCREWRTCGRMYSVVEYETDMRSRKLGRVAVVEVSARGIRWRDPEEPTSIDQAVATAMRWPLR